MNSRIETLERRLERAERRFRAMCGLAFAVVAGAMLLQSRPAAHADQSGGLPAIETRLSTLETDVSRLKGKTEPLTLVPGTALKPPEVVFSGVNVRIVNGLGRTDTMNSVGNLIVGYNELRTGPRQELEVPNDPAINHRAGSHNIILGTKNNYAGFGGLVAGETNMIDGPCAAVLGGLNNYAMGRTSILAGCYNRASGEYSSIAGGFYGSTLGVGSTVAGGYDAAVYPDYDSTAGSYGGLFGTGGYYYQF